MKMKIAGRECSVHFGIYPDGTTQITARDWENNLVTEMTLHMDDYTTHNDIKANVCYVPNDFVEEAEAAGVIHTVVAVPNGLQLLWKCNLSDKSFVERNRQIEAIVKRG